MLVYACYFPFAYSMIPSHILSSFAMSSTVLFLIMVWMGSAFSMAQSEIIEQIVYLKKELKWHVPFSKIIIILIISFFLGVLAIVYPCLISLFNHTNVFTREIVLLDISVSLVSHVLFGFIGGMIGLLIYNRIIKNQKLRILILPVFALLSIVHSFVETDLPICKVVTWIFPPLYRAIDGLSKEEYVNLIAVFSSFGVLLLYGIIQIFIYLIQYKKVKF